MHLCLAALRKLEISRYSGAFTPCQTGASTRKNVNLFMREPYAISKLCKKRAQAGNIF
jgi:hypothetical protein